MSRTWRTLVLIGAVVIIAGGGYLLASTRSSTAKISPIETTGTATSSGNGELVPTTMEQLSVEGVTSTIVGSVEWFSRTPAIAVSFNANGSLTGKIGTGPSIMGTWLLYTSTNAPADLAKLVLDPDDVFLRLAFANQHEDFLVATAATSTLQLGPLGKPGLITLTRN